jgi:hypothetical protein
MSTRRSRPLAEECRRLSTGQLRHLVTPESVDYVLRSGQRLELRWSRCRGCFGDGEGWALLFACPDCDRNCRVLWLPPGRGWGCWRCRPVSHPSHRRSGSKAGRIKPPSWRLDQLDVAQARTAALLGLQEWPPNKLIWTWRDLEAAPVLPDAPRLSPWRRRTLLTRLECLEALRLAVISGGICTEEQAMAGLFPAWPEVGKLAKTAVICERFSRWAMRRSPHDARTLRARRTQRRTTRPGKSTEG